MPIERVTVSGGELLTAAMMIYLVIARLRADAMHEGTGEAGVLILDNPLGKANKALLLKTQIGLADAMGIQLFYTTGVQDTSALAAFENIVRLRRNRQSPRHAPHPCGDRGDARAHRQGHEQRRLGGSACRVGSRLACRPSRERSAPSASGAFACPSSATHIFAPTRTPSMRRIFAGVSLDALRRL